jgi:hypothetical protein
MTDKKQEISVEGRIGHYSQVLHSLCHARAETPEHCKVARETLDTAITQTGKLLVILINAEMPQAH